MILSSLRPAVLLCDRASPAFFRMSSSCAAGIDKPSATMTASNRIA